MKKSELRFKPIIYANNSAPDVTIPFGYQHQKVAFFDVVENQSTYIAPLLIQRINERE